MIIFSDSTDDTEIVFTLESLTQAGIIFVMALAIIITNVLIIATFLNFRGKPISFLIYDILYENDLKEYC